MKLVIAGTVNTQSLTIQRLVRMLKKRLPSNTVWLKRLDIPYSSLEGWAVDTREASPPEEYANLVITSDTPFAISYRSLLEQASSILYVVSPTSLTHGLQEMCDLSYMLLNHRKKLVVHWTTEKESGKGYSEVQKGAIARLSQVLLSMGVVMGENDILLLDQLK
jgi:hypothetical protein